MSRSLGEPLMRGRESDRTFYAEAGGGGEEPFAPDDIPGLLLWLEADALELADGADVTTWADSGPAGNDFGDPGGASIPKHETNILNGKPVVRWAGGSGYLQCATLEDTQPYTIWFVMDMTNDANTPGVFFYDEDSTDLAVDSTAAPDTQWVMDAGSSTHFGLTAGGFHILGAVFDGADSVGYDDGAPTAGPATGTFPWLGGFTSLGNKYSNAPRDIAEVLFYDSRLSETDLNLVGNYLADKYALTWTDI